MSGCPLFAQAAALLSLRAKLLWRMTWGQGRGIGRLVLVLFSFGAGLFFSAAVSFAVFQWTELIRSDPAGLAARGGPLVVFATSLALVVVGRLWFAFLPRGQTAPPFDPRRFLVFAVPARLVSALNFAAQLVDPAWLFFWPVLVALAAGCANLPGMPGVGTLLAAAALAVWAVAGLLQLFASLTAALDARGPLRRTVQVLLFLAAFAGLQLAVARPDRPAAIGSFASRHWEIVRWTPPGWAASFVAAVADARVLPALGFAALLLMSGLAASFAAHAVSLREARRPVDAGTASRRAARGHGWAVPGLSDPVSAVVEKEAKTIVRVGWLQLVVIPVGFLLLRSVMFSGDAPRVLGRAPILFAAVYAHLGILEFATNIFGRDLSGARAWFLWPVSARAVIAAKNAVAYAFSFVIFAVLVAVAVATGPVRPEEIAVGALAHLAIFPVLAALGNVASILWPVPVRGMRFRRVRGSGPIGARFVALAALALAAWAPAGVARLLGLPLAVAYAGELLALGTAYGGLLSAAAHLFESKREPLLAALAHDE